jgi:hypothetical protein
MGSNSSIARFRGVGAGDDLDGHTAWSEAVDTFAHPLLGVAATSRAAKPAPVRRNPNSAIMA